MKVNGVKVDVNNVELSGEDLLNIFVSVAKDTKAYVMGKALICQFIDVFCSTHDEDVVELGAQIISSVQMCRLTCGDLSESEVRRMGDVIGASEDEIEELLNMIGGDIDDDNNA